MKEETVKKMNASHTKILQMDYGYGVAIKDDNIIFHSGGLGGVNTYLVRNAKENIVIILLFNKEVLGLRQLTWNLYELIQGRKVELPATLPKYKINTDEAMKFPGVYNVSISGIDFTRVEIIKNKDDFSFVVDDYNMYYGYPISKNNFQLMNEEFIVPFTVNEKGEALLLGAKRSKY